MKKIVSSRTRVIILLIFSFVLLYSLLSNLFSLNSIQTVNKAIALISLFSLSLAYLIGNLKRIGVKVSNLNLGTKRYFGIYGFFIAAVHILISTLNIATENYFYLNENTVLTAEAQLLVLFGISGFGVFIFPAISSIKTVSKSMSRAKWLSMQRKGYWGLLLVVIHVVVNLLESNKHSVLETNNKILILAALSFGMVTLLLKLITMKLYKK